MAVGQNFPLCFTRGIINKVRYWPRVFVFLFLIVGLFSIQPQASSHVALVSTSPQENSTVEHLPARVVIEFNQPLLIIGAGKSNSLAVTSKSGATATKGQAQVRGSTISIALKQTLTEGGAFTVSYRVVSKDGHRVSGGYKFTLVNKAGENANPAPTAMSKNGQNNRNLRPMYGVLGVLALLTIGGWMLYRARFAHRK